MEAPLLTSIDKTLVTFQTLMQGNNKRNKIDTGWKGLNENAEMKATHVLFSVCQFYLEYAIICIFFLQLIPFKLSYINV